MGPLALEILWVETGPTGHSSPSSTLRSTPVFASCILAQDRSWSCHPKRRFPPLLPDRPTVLFVLYWPRGTQASQCFKKPKLEPLSHRSVLLIALTIRTVALNQQRKPTGHQRNRCPQPGHLPGQDQLGCSCQAAAGVLDGGESCWSPSQCHLLRRLQLFPEDKAALVFVTTAVC